MIGRWISRALPAAALSLVAVILAPEGALGAVPPELVVDGATSKVTLTVGGDASIPSQSVRLGRSPAPNEFTLSGFLTFPEIEFAFQQIVAPVQDVPASGNFVSATGQLTIDTIVKVNDSAGHSLEIPTTFTTGELNVGICPDSMAFCITGFPGGPYCNGSPYNPTTGDLRLVAFVMIPADSESLIASHCIEFEIDATIDPGDADSDSVKDFADNCPTASNISQADTDGDGVGNSCDNCLSVDNTLQGDFDADGAGDLCDPFRINVQPCASAIPAGYVKDCAQPYNSPPGYGWDIDFSAQCRDRNVNADQSLDTFCFTTPVRKFEIDLDPGDYDVTATAGDPSNTQGPQRVVAEGVVLINNVMTAPNVFATGTSRVRVRDGRLTVEIGGGGGNTTLNKLEIAWPSEPQQPARLYAWNFQPAAAPVPRGYQVDGGEADTPDTRWGWDAAVATVDRNASSYQVFDTFAATPNGVWESEVSNLCYVVNACAGDFSFAQGPQLVSAEGVTLIPSVFTPAGQFACGAAAVKVSDGRLTLSAGNTFVDTTINFVTAATTPLDFDLDGHDNCLDNCPNLANPVQTDTDADGMGDACDPDDDGDGAADGSDCAPLVSGAFATPVEVAGLSVTGEATSMVTWTSQASTAGNATQYDLVTGSLGALHSSGSFSGFTCVSNLFVTNYPDPTVPALGDALYYLVDAENVCGSGGYGDSTQVPDSRDSLACP